MLLPLSAFHIGEDLFKSAFPISPLSVLCYSTFRLQFGGLPALYD